ncbi:MAG: response regulator [Robiginitomaculum sp.]|nr:response regulator [Robiginitomaculum sp.]
MDEYLSQTGQSGVILEKEIESHRVTSGLELEFFTILDAAVDIGISILDEDLNYLYINKFAAKTMHLTPENFSVGDSLSKVHKIMIDNDVIDPKILNQNKLSSGELQTLYKGGAALYKGLTPLKDGSIQRLTRLHTKNNLTISINHDVTKLVQKEEMLQRSLELGNSGYWTYDFRQKKIELSPSIRTILSQAEEDLVHANGILATIHRDDRHIFKDALKHMSKSGDTIDFTYRNLAGDKWFRTTGNSERGQNGKLVKLRAFVKDVTAETVQAIELEKAKDEAIAANIAKSEFLANMSHEIRTPMNGVLGMAELLAETNIDDKQREFIKVINQSSNALLTIINDILDFSKIEAGAFELDPTPFDLRASLDDVASLLKINVQEKGLELIINYPPDMDSFFVGDAGRLRQIIMNLVGNAIKFTEHGHILIKISVKKYSENRAELTIGITDTGIGIEAEKLEHIFEKFTQADNSTTRVYGGTGLGLSISKRIIELMGGRLEVNSIFGEGSTFSFSVPIPIDTTAQHAPKDITSLHGLRALIVDDIEINRNILKERLNLWKMDYVEAQNSIDALTALKQAKNAHMPFDVILLDYQMPGMNGFELAQMLTNKLEQNKTPIIMLSSCDQTVSSKELQILGIDTFLLKPVRDSLLYDSLVNLMAHQTPQRRPETVSTNQFAEPTTCELPNMVSTDIHILVAEDFPLNQDVVRLMLEDSEYDPVFANNGKEAVDMFQANPNKYAAILMDISMPVMDGYEAAERIRAVQAMNGAQAIPIIALTGHALKHDKEKCLGASMNDYLTKPVKRSNLIRVLDQWTKGQALQAKIA